MSGDVVLDLSKPAHTKGGGKVYCVLIGVLLVACAGLAPTHRWRGGPLRKRMVCNHHPGGEHVGARGAGLRKRAAR